MDAIALALALGVHDRPNSTRAAGEAWRQTPRGGSGYSLEKL